MNKVIKSKSDPAWLPRQQTGVNIFIHFFEFAELAEFLSDEGKASFLDGLRGAVHHALDPQPYWLELFDDGSASLAIGDLSKSKAPKLMEFVEAVFRDLRLWAGTFGKIGIPPMKYGMAALIGEFVIAPATPRISGQTLANATFLAKKFCSQFDVQIAIEADLARFASHAPEWIDIDDLDLPLENTAQTQAKRIFTRLIEREEPEDVQLLKAARKSFFQKDYVDAKAKFDRLSRLRQFKHLSQVYLQRLKKISAKT